MTTPNVSIEMPEHDERCRQLAELHVTNLNGDGSGHFYAENVIRYDPRFASLRGEHDWWGKYYTDKVCYHCHIQVDQSAPGTHYCLRTDGDAMDEAIAACGFRLELTPRQVWRDGSETEPWRVKLIPLHSTGWRILASGATPREAKSAALWQAMFGGAGG